ncbi:uncharacterized protein DEA37_0003695 [Paragonimus westermani]|uniref:Leucine-rich repeat-containing protein 40 n=1 Tax=Paragonimus westermani TaxID=34504 RepID=A0A5J4NBK6_9TREM|nr:uncharacterized protein DEA37_0003695 [Paragonimus westermani]
MNFEVNFGRNETLQPVTNIHIKVLRQAQQTGILNLSNRNLTYLPSNVWELNKPLPPEEGADVIDLDRSSDGPRWWETQPISRLILTSNLLTTLSGDGLIKLDTLTHLDVRDNRLSDLPSEIGELVNLKSLVLR